MRMRDFSLRVRPRVTHDGNVLIDIDNAGRLNHEVVVVRGDKPETLPLTAAGAVDVDRAGVVDRVKEFPPGRFRVMSPDMRRGSYLVFCNLVTADAAGRQVSHFQQGMRGSFRIQQSDEEEPA